MKIREFLNNSAFDVNANVRIFEGGQWNDDGVECAYFSCGNLTPRVHRTTTEILDSSITYITTDDNGCIIIECDLK